MRIGFEVPLRTFEGVVLLQAARLPCWAAGLNGHRYDTQCTRHSLTCRIKHYERLTLHICLLLQLMKLQDSEMRTPKRNDDDARHVQSERKQLVVTEKYHYRQKDHQRHASRSVSAFGDVEAEWR